MLQTFFTHWVLKGNWALQGLSNGTLKILQGNAVELSKGTLVTQVTWALGHSGTLALVHSRHVILQARLFIKISKHIGNVYLIFHLSIFTVLAWWRHPIIFEIYVNLLDLHCIRCISHYLFSQKGFILHCKKRRYFLLRISPLNWHSY